MPKKTSAFQLQREIDETLARKSHATKRSTPRSTWAPVVGSHDLGTADVRTGDGAYWIVTVPTGYRVDYKPWGPSNETVLGTFPSQQRARAEITKHAGGAAAIRSHATIKSRARSQHKPESPISDDQAVEIANAWHSVMTWNDPGVTMYSVSSTGKIHNEKHRKQLLAYIATCIPQAKKQDAAGEPGIITESNVADLEALRDWAKAFPLKKQR